MKQITDIKLDSDNLSKIISSPNFYLRLHIFNPDYDVSFTKDIQALSEIGKTISTDLDILKIDIGKQVRDNGYFNGTYNIKYEFIIKEYQIKLIQISNNRTEIKTNSRLNLNKEFNNQFLYYRNINNLIINYTEKEPYSYLKLASPIINGIGPGEIVDVFTKVFDDYEDSISIITKIEEDKTNKLNILKAPTQRPKNLATGATKLYNFQDLVPDDINDVYVYIKSNIKNGMTLKRNYTDFSKFVKFSSAVGRISSFRNKLKEIESLESKLTQVESVSGSINTVYKQKVLDDIISVKESFDDFEHYSYYNSGSSITIDDEEYPALTVPKSNESWPYELVSTSSTEFKNWYSSVNSWAIKYDNNNSDSIINLIPTLIKLDRRNNKFVNFMLIVGHMLDIIYGYMDSITELKNTTYDEMSGAPFDLLLELLNNYNFSVKSTYAIKTIKQYIYETSA